MATEEAEPIHPGDIIQDAEGVVYLASEVHGWGVGATLISRSAYGVGETYHRLKPGQFVKVGEARFMPEAVVGRRRDSLRQAAEIAAERAREAGQ